MTRSPVFRPAADRYLPLGIAAFSAGMIVWVTQIWGLAVHKEQFGPLLIARRLAGGAPFAFGVTDFPAGPLWPLWLSFFAKTGFAIESVARFGQALVTALLLYTLTRFYLRHLLSRAIVAGTALAACTGMLLLGEVYTLSPVPTMMLLATLGLLALARFLLEEQVLAFLAATACLTAAALLWIPAVALSAGAALAILLGGRGNLARRATGAMFFSAAAIVPVMLVLIQSGWPESSGILAGFLVGLDQLTAWSMWAAWPMWLRSILTLFVLVGLVLVYWVTRGPAGIGPALKRRELQLWILISIVWTLQLLVMPLSATLLPLLPALVLWPALGLDSFRDYTPVARELSGRGARFAVWASAILLIIPVWQTITGAWWLYRAGDGVRGFQWQTSPVVYEVRTGPQWPLYSDQPELAQYVLDRPLRQLPTDLSNLELTESRIFILGDSCPPGFCDAAAQHPTLAITASLATRDAFLYDVTLRPAEPALTASDSLIIP
ncbi:MAG: hypothetical protein IPK53_18615 [bacterium]|nr:hypothetical protein [bacterium]